MKARPFLITGLPRSRTAWFAAVASACVPGAICYHEPTASLSDWEDVFELWNREDYEWVGISDAGLGFRLPVIMKRIQPQLLIIERAIGEVERSLKAATKLPMNNYCDLLHARLVEQKNHPLAHCVAYSDLNERGIVTRCLQWLMPNAWVDDLKLCQFMNFNVQTDLDRTFALARENGGMAREMMGGDVVQLRMKET